MRRNTNYFYGGRQENTCYKVFCWILQIGVWATFILTIIGLQNDKSYFIYFFIVYAVYLIFEFCSNTVRFILIKIIKKEYMKKWEKSFKLLQILNYIMNVIIQKEIYTEDLILCHIIQQEMLVVFLP